jgi:cobalt-zinc-cadmium efflux system outer membrane protein
MRFRQSWVFATILAAASAHATCAQEIAPPGRIEKLADLLSEAKKNNPQIQAARQSAESARQAQTQVATLPDPQVMVQHFSVGSPRPFAGYTNSDFAYIGLGFSQDIPYPGKLRLRGEIAKKDAEVMQQQVESVRRSVLSQVKTAYVQLSYLARRATILDNDGEFLKQVAQAAEARYRSGMGNQQEVLQAQIERTKLLRAITMNQLEGGKAQAALKQLLGRTQTSPDIEGEELTETGTPHTFEELLDAAKKNNPDIAAAQESIATRGLQVDLAKKDFYPDFNVQYMWQRTDPTQFRAYYMATLGMRIPIYRGRRQQKELARAKAEQNRARSESETREQQTAFALRQEYLTQEKSAELLKIYREGLMPQARAELQAGMAAYESNRQDFQALLASFLDVLKLDEEYWQTLAEHETALAHLEEMTGWELRESAK